MKKLLAAALCILIMLCATTDCHAVQAELKMSLDHSDIYVGDTVTLTVSFNAEENMNAYFYRLKYDSSKMSFISTSAENYNAMSDEIVYIYTGDTSAATETFTFTCVGEGEASFNVTDIIYADTEEYYLSEVSLYCNIQYVQTGDVDGNGAIQTADMANLKLYLAGVGDEGVVLNGADMDKNGVIESTDLANLKLYLAGVK